MDKFELIKSIIENNQKGIPKATLEAIALKYLKDPKSFDIRDVVVPGEKKRVDGTRNENTTLNNQIALITRIINDVSNELQGYEEQADLQQFYQEKGMASEFNLSKEELSKLFSLTKQDIATYYSLGNKANLPEKITTILDTMKRGIDYEEEHIGATKQESVISPFYDVKIDTQTKSTYDYRIYLNSPQTNEMEEFLNEYIYECYKRKIPYDMKGIRNQKASSKDGTVLYTTQGFLTETVDALKIASEKMPEFLQDFGQPVHLTGEIPYLNSENGRWCGFSHRGGSTNMQTYNDFMNSNIQLSVIHAMCQTSNNFSTQFKAFLKSSFSQEDLQAFLTMDDVSLVSSGLNVSKKFQFKNAKESQITDLLLSQDPKTTKAMQTVLSKIMEDDKSKEEFLNQLGENIQRFSVMRNLEISDKTKVPSIDPCIGATMFNEFDELSKNNFQNNETPIVEEVIEAANNDNEYSTSSLQASTDVIVKTAEKNILRNATDKDLESSDKKDNTLRPVQDFEL